MFFSLRYDAAYAAAERAALSFALLILLILSPPPLDDYCFRHALLCLLMPFDYYACLMPLIFALTAAAYAALPPLRHFSLPLTLYA